MSIGWLIHVFLYFQADELLSEDVTQSACESQIHQMRKKNIINTYNFYAHFYDLIFGRVLDSARKKVIKSMKLEDGEKILEMGVGTGLSFRHYPNNKSLQIYGIDISDKMLKQAQKRIRKFPDKKIILENMDAENTSFPDDHFDKVVLMYIYSVTPNPPNLLAEAFRICKPDGDVYIINHFSHSKGGKSSFLERLFRSMSDTIGFRSDFSYQTYVEDLKLGVDKKMSANLFSLTRILKLRKVDNRHLLKLKKIKMDKEILL